MRDLSLVLKETFNVKPKAIDIVLRVLYLNDITEESTDIEISEVLQQTVPMSNKNVIEIYNVDYWLDPDYFYMDANFNIRLHPDAPEGLIPQPKGFVYYDYMFNGIGDADSVWDISHWDMSNVISTANMFEECSAKTVGDLSNWKFEKLISAASMFEFADVVSFGDLSKWNVSTVYYFYRMFYGCYTENFGDLSNWVIDSDAMVAEMFAECKVKDIGNIDGWNLGASIYLDGVFKNAEFLHYDNDFALKEAIDKRYRDALRSIKERLLNTIE